MLSPSTRLHPADASKCQAAQASQSITWVFDRDSARNPFIGIAIETLRAAGSDVFMIDGADKPTGAPNTVHPFSRGGRFRRYEAAKAFINTSPLIRIFDRREFMRTTGERLRALKGEGRGAGVGAIILRLQIYAAAAVSAVHYLLWRGVRRLALIRRDTIDLWVPYTKGFFSTLRRAGDVIIVSRPTTLLGAWIAAKLKRARLVYYPFELYGEQAAESSKSVLASERWVLGRGVDALITQNAERASVYAERGHLGPAHIVHNYKPLAVTAGRGGLRRAFGIPAGKKIVLYEGMLIPGRWLDRLAQASLLLPDDAVMVFLGPTKAWWDQNHEAFTREPVAKGKLIIAPPVAHEALLEFIADADAGVIIYDDSLLNNYYCEPGKLSDYAFSRIPVIAPDFPTIAPVVRRLAIGACFREPTPEAIAASIMEVLSRPRADWRPALDAAAPLLSWEKQAPALLAAVYGTTAPAQGARRLAEKDRRRNGLPSPASGRGVGGEGPSTSAALADRPSPLSPLPRAGEGDASLTTGAIRHIGLVAKSDSRQLIDILILIEHVDRELDVACLIAALIAREAPRLKVKIANFYAEAQQLIATAAPRVVVTPFFYSIDDAIMRDYVAAWSRSIFVNLAWEQILYGSQQTLKRPRDAFTRDRVRHVAWSEWFRDYLVGHGVMPDNALWLGHPLYDLYTEDLRGYFTDRRALARAFGLDPRRQWVFFPENFRWAFLSDKRLAELSAQGVDPGDLEAQRSYCKEALAASVRWLAVAAKTGRVEAILRPRPAVNSALMREFVVREIGAVPPGFHILKQKSAREWVFASDVVASSISTTLIEAAVAGRPILRLSPTEVPDSLWYDWCSDVPVSKTEAELLAAIEAPDLSGTNAVRKWAMKSFKVGGAPTEAIARLLIRLSNRAPRGRGLVPPTPETPPWLHALAPYAPLRLRHKLRARYQPGYFFNSETHEKDLFGEAEVRRRAAAWRRILRRSEKAA